MKKFFIAAISIVFLFSDSFDEYKSSQYTEFNNFNKEFETYQKLLDDEYNNYKKELKAYWDKPTLSDKKTWVEYTKDMKARKSVDFEKGEVSIEVIAKDENSAKQSIVKELLKTLTSDTQQAQENDILEQRIATKLGKKQQVENKPILAPLLLEGKKNTKELVGFASEAINKNGVTKSNSKLAGNNLYKVTIKLPKDSQKKLALNYKDEILTQSKRRGLDPALVYAIMQTESNFNPRARSHIPAFGLMQIVPRSAGVDAYMYIYNKRVILSPTYLYSAKNNIELGSTYLHILMTRYFKGVNDYKSRLYCAIAGYNTGAGNVSKAFRGDYNVYKAYPKINSMSSEEVYNYLIKNLKYKEARDYLQRVRDRMKYYN